MFGRKFMVSLILLVACSSQQDNPADTGICDTYTFSGVVSSRPDTLIPNPDVVVIITDYNGKELVDTTDANGNFSITASACLPYSAKVSKGGNTMNMNTKPSTPDCATCHTPDGQAGAYIYIQ